MSYALFLPGTGCSALLNETGTVDLPKSIFDLLGAEVVVVLKNRHPVITKKRDIPPLNRANLGVIARCVSAHLELTHF